MKRSLRWQTLGTALGIAAITAASGCAAAPPASERPVVQAAPPAPEMPRPYVDDRELEARLVLAIGLNKQAEWRAAMVHLEVLMQEWSGLWTVQLEFARALYRLDGDVEVVRTALEESIRLRAHNPRAYLMLGQLHEDQGELSEAETRYRTAIEQRSSDSSPHLALARVLRRDGRPAEAVEVLGGLLERRDANQGRTLQLLAGAQEEAGLIEDARTTYRLAANSHSDPLRGHITYLRFLKRIGDTETAATVQLEVEELRREREGGRAMRPLRPSAN